MARIDELIKQRRCLDILFDGVEAEIGDNINVDMDIAKRQVLTKAIIEFFYAWLRHNDIEIELEG